MGTTDTPPAPRGTNHTAVTTEEWAGRALHNIVCPTGAAVVIRIPNLAELIRTQLVPSRLMQTAIRELISPGVVPIKASGEAEPGTEAGEASVEWDVDEIGRMLELSEWLVTEMLVEPKLTVEDLRDPARRPPAQDIDMLISIARRDRDWDARGVKIGVFPIDRAATFRRNHGCTADCEACAESGRELSTLDRGGL
jgi:hypothetical protein